MNPKRGGVLTSSRRKDSLRRSRRLPFSFGGERAPRKRFDTRRHVFAFPRRVPCCNTAAKRTSSSPIPLDVLFLLSYSCKNQLEEEESVDSSFQSDSSFQHFFFAFFSVFSVLRVHSTRKKNTHTVAPHNSNALLKHSNYTHTRSSMPVGNLRTAANDERDDDPRALRPIPIATKDVVSFVEKNNPPGQNAEVVRRLLMFSLFFPNVSI